jgi:hypothetical protein
MVKKIYHSLSRAIEMLHGAKRRAERTLSQLTGQQSDTSFGFHECIGVVHDSGA